jgi:ATP-dependent RNA helicase RhlE
MKFFKELELIKPVLRAIENEGYTKPTPIQSKAIPEILRKRDIIGCAQTGTGKTAAFAIPIIQLMSGDRQLSNGNRKIRALIITPTRELATQIGESFSNYGKYTQLKYQVIFGGVKQGAQVTSLKSGIDILIATPGRLLDLMNQKIINLNSIEYFVLDEADRMLDMGFIHDVNRIISHLPRKRQSLFFSATMPPAIVNLSKKILSNPIKIEVNPPASTVDKINQVVYFIDKKNKRHLLRDLLGDSKIERVLVFTRTKHGADKVARDLSKAGISALAIHGNKTQSAREKALNTFKQKTTRALIATDIAARGIDIEDLTYVINYDIPNIPDSYVHRIGRTGRAGAGGNAIGFCDYSEKDYLKKIQKLIGKQIQIIENHKFPMLVLN